MSASVALLTIVLSCSHLCHNSTPSVVDAIFPTNYCSYFLPHCSAEGPIKETYAISEPVIDDKGAHWTQFDVTLPMMGSFNFSWSTLLGKFDANGDCPYFIDAKVTLVDGSTLVHVKEGKSIVCSVALIRLHVLQRYR